MKLRQGMHRGRMVYFQVGEEPVDSDPFVAMCETATLAEVFCRTVNDSGYAVGVVAAVLDSTASARGLAESPYGRKLARDLFGKTEEPEQGTEEVGKDKAHEPSIVDAYGNNSGYIARLVCSCGAVFFGAVQATAAQAKYNVRLQYKRVGALHKTMTEEKSD